jgi:hypothetical protein
VALVPLHVAPLPFFQQQQTQLEELQIRLQKLIPQVGISSTNQGSLLHRTIHLRIMQQRVLQLVIALVSGKTRLSKVFSSIFFPIRSSLSCHRHRAPRHFLLAIE